MNDEPELLRRIVQLENGIQASNERIDSLRFALGAATAQMQERQNEFLTNRQGHSVAEDSKSQLSAISIVGIALTFAGLIITYWNFAVFRDNQYLAAVETRIPACLTVSEFHKNAMTYEGKSETRSNTIEENKVTPHYPRYARAADLARELSLCLAKGLPDVDAVKDCISNIGDRYSVWDTEGGAEEVFKLNPAC